MANIFSKLKKRKEAQEAMGREGATEKTVKKAQEAAAEFRNGSKDKKKKQPKYMP